MASEQVLIDQIRGEISTLMRSLDNLHNLRREAERRKLAITANTVVNTVNADLVEGSEKDLFKTLDAIEKIVDKPESIVLYDWKR